MYAEYIVSPERVGNEPRGYYPMGIRLAELPGFSEYEYTYSRVRVLSMSATIVADQAGEGLFYNGFAVAPSFDFISTQLMINSAGASSATSLVYANVPVPSGYNAYTHMGQMLGVRVGNKTYRANTEPLGSGYDNISGGTPGGNDHVLKDSTSSYVMTNNTTGELKVKAMNEAKPEGFEPAAVGVEATVPITAAGVSSGALPGATFNQLSQLKRFRTRFFSDNTRSFKIRFVPYTFMTGDVPVDGLEFKTVPKYFSSRRWMPIEWFSTAAGKQCMNLIGPYVAPIMNQEVTDQQVLHIYFHVRLQFAGQV